MSYRHARVIFICLFVLGLLLRLVNREEAMYYLNDQGLLLLTTERAMFEGRLPPVGPPISLSGAFIPPFMYAIVGLFMALSRDPAAIALGYMFMNMTAGVLVLIWVRLVVGAAPALWAFGAVMLSASMVENGRSIWHAHPTFLLVTLYLVLTELAYTKKHLWLYGAGIAVYAFAVVTYPTPLLLLPFVLVRSVSHFRAFGLGGRSAVASLVLVCGMLFAAHAPWLMTHWEVVSAMALRTTGALHISTFPAAVYLLYTYLSAIVHDVFQLSFLLPPYMVGSIWIKVLAILTILLTFTRLRTRSPYPFLVVGLVAAAFFGIHMPAYRLLPFYPFVFLAFSIWVSRWIIARGWMKRTVVFVILLFYIVGNMRSWVFSTLTHPRNDYQRMRVLAQTIAEDARASEIPESDIGVHYATPLDTNDYYGAPLFYLLHQEIHLPISYTPLGNELRRGGEETHARAYLVCDGFDASSTPAHCVHPYTRYWQGYREVGTLHPSSSSAIFVFQRMSP